MFLLRHGWITQDQLFHMPFVEIKLILAAPKCHNVYDLRSSSIYYTLSGFHSNAAGPVGRCFRAKKRGSEEVDDVSK